MAWCFPYYCLGGASRSEVVARLADFSQDFFSFMAQDSSKLSNLRSFRHCFLQSLQRRLAFRSGQHEARPACVIALQTSHPACSMSAIARK
jgi:hypothetical protein